MWWYVGAVLIAASVLGVAQAIPQLQSDTPGAMDAVWTALAAAAAAVAVLVTPVLRWRQTVVCYADGIVCHRLLGDTTVRRDELTSVTLIHHRGKHHAYDEVQMRTATRSVSVVGIEHAEQLSNHVNALLRGGPSPAHAGAWTPPS